MDRTELILLIAIWVSVLALAIVTARKRATMRRKIEKELAHKVLDPAFIKSLRKEIHTTIEQSVKKSLLEFTKDNEVLRDHLRELTEKAVIDYVDSAHKKLEDAYGEHAQKLSEVTANAEAAVANEVNSFSQKLQLMSSDTIPAQVKKFTNQLQEIQEHVIPSQIQIFEKKLEDINAGFSDVEAEITAYTKGYQEKVQTRITHLVDDQAAEILSNYLNASLSGIDFGEQQDFILDRLEQNKDALKNELGV